MNVDDAEKYAEWMNDFKVTDCLGSSARIMNVDSERQWLQDTGRKDINFAIVSLDKDELMGNCGIMNISHIHRTVANKRAIACYKKVGFKECGRRRESYFLNGKYYDEIQIDILAREFEGGYIRNRNI